MITDKNIKDLLKSLPKGHEYVLLSREYIVPFYVEGLYFPLTDPCNDKFEIIGEFGDEKEAKKAYDKTFNGSRLTKDHGKLAGLIADVVLVDPDDEIYLSSPTEKGYKVHYLQEVHGLDWDEEDLDIELNFYVRKGKRYYDGMDFNNFDELYDYTEDFYRRWKRNPKPKDPNSVAMMDFDITCYTEEGKVKLSFEDVDYHEVFDMVWNMKNS
jgi:hypothetical protein